MADTVQQLMELGFSEYEAKAYAAMRRLGPANGYQVAKESGVPRSAVYQVLDRLVARGAVLAQSLGETTRYLAVPADLLLERLRSEFDATLTALGQGFAAASAAPSPSGQAWSVVGRANVFAMARSVIERATADVLVCTGDDDELDALAAWLRRAQARGLAVQVLSSVPYLAGDLPVAVHREGLAFRQAVGHGLTLVVDGREALIGEVDRSESAAWTTNSYVVAWLRWSLAEQFAAAQ
jgi:HTH-type transcriptional regulator, sugar sensing transcriptional regulator